MPVAGWDLWLIVLFLVLYLAVAVLAAVTGAGRRWWLLSGGMLALLLAGLLSHGILRTVLVDLAAFVSVALVLETGSASAARAARRYLGMLLVAVICILAALFLGGEAAQAPAGILSKVIPALFLVGFALKLAFVPLYFWLPAVAESARPLTAVMIISFVDIAAFNELAQLRETSAWIFTSIQPIWLALALLSMFAGALLAFTQRDVKRMLAFSTIDDFGYLLLGLVAGGQGIEGARLGAVSHAVMKLLLFGALAVVEFRLGRPVRMDERGLAARFPVAAAAFITGALGMIGIPPTLGFLGRWRLYQAAAGLGGFGLLAAVLLATGLALLYYVRVIHRVWLGAPGSQDTPAEPRPAIWALAALAVLAIAAGLYPGLWSAFLP